MVEHGPPREDPGGAVLVDHDERRHRRRGGHAGRPRLLLGGAAAGAVPMPDMSFHCISLRKAHGKRTRKKEMAK